MKSFLKNMLTCLLSLKSIYEVDNTGTHPSLFNIKNDIYKLREAMEGLDIYKHFYI